MIKKGERRKEETRNGEGESFILNSNFIIDLYFVSEYDPVLVAMSNKFITANVRMSLGQA